MTQIMRKLEQQVGAWPHVSVHPHRFGGWEFRFGNAELGHVHVGGTVDIPFPRAVRDALLAQGLAEGHHWVPNSGWTTFHVRGEGDLKHALWLMRLSYLRYALKTASDPHGMLEHESEAPGLSSHLRSLLQLHLPTRAESVSADPLTA
jgi:Luciferase